MGWSTKTFEVDLNGKCWGGAEGISQEPIPGAEEDKRKQEIEDMYSEADEVRAIQNGRVPCRERLQRFLCACELSRLCDYLL